jgi:Tol biopolymer transport system component
MNADGSNPVNISKNPSVDSEPGWAPSGEKIAFSSNRDGNFDIFTMSADGSNQTNITRSNRHDAYPDWFPIVVRSLA